MWQGSDLTGLAVGKPQVDPARHSTWPHPRGQALGGDVMAGWESLGLLLPGAPPRLGLGLAAGASLCPRGRAASLPPPCSASSSSGLLTLVPAP